MGTGGIVLHSYNEVTLLPPGALKTTTGTFFKKFTPFKDKFLEVYKNPAPLPVPAFIPKKLPLTLGYTTVTRESP